MAGASLLFVAALIIGATPASAGTITVTTTAQSPGAGSDCTLGEAITAANTDSAVDGCSAGSGADTIQLPAGIYVLSLVDNNNGVGGAPLGVPAITASVILEGQTGVAADVVIERFSGAAEFSFTHVASGTMTLKHLTVRQFGAPFGFEGGALTVGSASIENCVFSDNLARQGGGAVTSAGSAGSLSVTDSSFFNNTTAPASNGGAILIQSGPLVVSNSRFNDNASGSGGAIHVSGGSHFIVDSTFDSNTAGIGGAINVAGTGAFGATSLQITRGVFLSNTASTDGAGGGAIQAAGTLAVIDSLFSGNQEVVETGTGGAIRGSGDWTISGSTFVGNSAAFGGALASSGNSAAVVTIANSTFSGNSAAKGGAIWHNLAGTLNLSNVTITQNSGGADGGGIAYTTDVVAVNIRNSIIAENFDAGNDSPDCSDEDSADKIVSLGYNLIGDGTGCSFPAIAGDLVGTLGSAIDPLLGALQGNSGITAGAAASQFVVETHPLLDGSPALDAGNPNNPDGEPADCETTDQRGVSRPLDANGDFVPRCDIGAVEQAATDLAITKTDDTGGSAIDIGGTVNYTISVTNNSATQANNVFMADILPAGVSFVDVAVVPVEQGSCSGTTTVLCDLGALGPSGSVDVTIEVTVTAPGAIANLAAVVADEPDANDDDNSALLITNVSAGCATAPAQYVSWLGGAGGAPDDWSVGANWRGGAVPTAPDSVYVCATAPNQPRLTANASAADVFVEAGGGSIDTNGFTLTASGSVVAGQAITGTGTLNMTGVGKTLIGSVPNLTISGSGSVSANGPVTVSGDLSITGGSFSPSANTVDVSGDLSTSGSGILIMLNDTDAVNVAGSADFSGGDERNKLVAGQLEVKGDFTVSCCVAFTGTNTHTVLLDGTITQTISMANASVGGNHFQELLITNTAGVILANHVHVRGNTSAIYAGVLPEVPESAPGIPVNGGGFNWNTTDFLMSVNGTLTLAQLTVFGNLSVPDDGYNVATTIFGGTGPQSVPILPYQSLTIASGADAVAASGNLATTGAMTVTGVMSLSGQTDVGASLSITGGSLTVNGQTLNVGSDLSTSGSGILVMTNAADVVNVPGTATFSGGDERNKLTSGVLKIKGDFSSTCCVTFTATGTHLTIFEGTTTQDINLANASAGGNHFQHLQVTAPGLVLLNNIHVLGNFDFPFLGSIDGIGRTFTLSGNFTVTDTESSLQLNSLVIAGALNVAGTYDVGTTTFTGTGPQAAPLLSYQNLTVASGSDVLPAPGNLVITGALIVTGTMALNGQTDIGTSVSVTGGSLTVGGSTLNVGTSFSTSGSGVIVMTDPGDMVVVPGDASFQGGDERNKLSAGVLRVGGNMSATCCVTFAASGNHTTVLENAGTATLSVANSSAGGNHFQHLQVTAPALMLANNLYTFGDFDFIPAGPISAAGFSATSEGAFTVLDPESSVTLANLFIKGQLNIGGAYTVGTTTFTGTGPQIVPLLPYQNLTIASGANVLPSAGNLVTTGGLTVTGTMALNGQTDIGTFVVITGASLTVNGHTLNVGTDFGTSGGGVLVMTSAADQVNVTGTAAFTGGDERNKLTAGVLRLLGDLSATCCVTFTASGNHTTSFEGSTATINTANASVGGNHFQHLQISAPELTLASHVYVLGDFDFIPAGAVSGSGFTFTTEGGFSALNPGSSVTLGTLAVKGPLLVAGAYTVDTTTFTGTGPQTIPILPYQNLTVASGADVLAAPVTPLIINGSLTVTGTTSLNAATTVGTSVSITGGSLTVNGQTLNIGADLNTSGAGVLVMTNAADTVTVNGHAVFNGGDSRNKLTNGVLRVRGNLTAPCCVRFVASGAHRTVFDGSSLSQQQNINTSNAGSGGNKFHHIEIAHATALNVNLIDNVFASGQLIVPSSVTPFIAGGFVTMTVSGLDVDGVTLQDLKLISNGGTITRFDNVAIFQGDGTATTLTIQHPGAASAFNFNNVQFQNTPTTGKFINATDTLADANVLTINMVGSTPADGTAFTQTAGGAVVNWGLVGPTQADVALQGINGPAPSGANLAYAVQVKNNGPDTATGVVLTDTLTNFQLAGVSATQGSCSGAAGVVSCNIGTLASGTTATVTVTVSANGVGWASHSFHASSASIDPDLSNNLKALTFGNREPKALAGSNQTVSATGTNGALVTLDGRGSSDPDGDALTYRWSGPFPEGGGTVTGATAAVTLPLGSSRVTLVVNDGQSDSPAAEVSVVVTDFGVSATGGAPIARGESATYTVAVRSVHGAFDREVAFTCANMPAFASCSFSPAMVTPNGTSATATLTVSTVVLASAAPPHSQAPPLWTFWYAVPAVGLLLAGRRRRRSNLLFAALLLLFLFGGLAACGGGGGNNLMKPVPPAPTLHTITVTGTSGALSHSTSVTLSVK